MRSFLYNLKLYIEIKLLTNLYWFLLFIFRGDEDDSKLDTSEF